MNGKPWTNEHTATLQAWAGKRSDARIGQMTGHCAITIRKRREAAGLPAYHADRATWTRREWLMASAAGLDFQISD